MSAHFFMSCHLEYESVRELLNFHFVSKGNNLMLSKESVYLSRSKVHWEYTVIGGLRHEKTGYHSTATLFLHYVQHGISNELGVSGKIL